MSEYHVIGKRLPRIDANAPGNMSREFHLKEGDVERGFLESDLVLEDTFTTQSAIHAYLEPHAALAEWDMCGRLTLHTSTQTPYYVQQHLALTLGINADRVRVIKPYVGGGFGGKSDGMAALDFCAALLSRKTGRPVKIVYSRDEEFTAARRKHLVTITMKTGVKKDGTLVARHCKAFLHGGAYCSLGPLTTVLVGAFQTFPYRIPTYQYDGYRIYTNKPPCGAMKGHGGPQAHFAQDVQLEKMNIKPFPKCESIAPIPIPVPGLSNLLTVNLYALGKGPITLIDTCLKAPGTLEYLGSDLRNAGLDIADVERIIITHGQVPSIKSLKLPPEEVLRPLQSPQSHQASL